MEFMIETNLEAYGLLAMVGLLLLSGVGLPIGEEMIVIPAGILIATGKFDPLTTAVCAWIAICTADFLWFTLCRRFGTPWLQRPWFKRLVHPRRLLEMKHQLDRRGMWFIVLARFIPSSRTAAITTAGIFRLSYWKFVLPTMICAALTVPLQLLVGWLIGSGLESERSWAAAGMRIAGVLAVGIVSIALVRWRRARKYGPRPKRAKAVWLRRLSGSARRNPRPTTDDESIAPTQPRSGRPEASPAAAGLSTPPSREKRIPIHS
jgi:membrane protein DedA with SNARE-associated domain